MGVIAVLTSTVLPSIGSFNRDQSLVQAVEIFAANLRLAREKSLSGIVLDPENAATRVWWGVNCNNANLREYQLGYALLDGAGNPQGFTLDTTETFSKDGSIRLSTCNGFPVYFKRISGDAPTLTSDPINITITNGTTTRNVQVYRSGNIVVN